MPLDFQQLYDAHAAALFAFLLNVTRCEADSRDILQEVFLKLVRRPELLDGVQNSRAFLLRLAHRQAIDGHRRRQSQAEAVERAGAERLDLFAPSTDPDENNFRDALTQALTTLPKEQRAVVHLRLWEQMTFAEIAEALGLPANTAASRYRYAIDKLQAHLRPLYEELR
jgi:RNA polymerase sigma-70 factor (ECF subfamily)